jgi:hypothetical protein
MRFLSGELADVLRIRLARCNSNLTRVEPHVAPPVSGLRPRGSDFRA